MYFSSLLCSVLKANIEIFLSSGPLGRGRSWRRRTITWSLFCSRWCGAAGAEDADGRSSLRFVVTMIKHLGICSCWLCQCSLFHLLESVKRCSERLDQNLALCACEGLTFML